MLDRKAGTLADMLGEDIAKLAVLGLEINSEGWHVSAQQIQNAINLLRDAERRLRNGDDLRG